MNSHFQSQDPSLPLTGDFSLDSLFSGTVKWVMAPNFVPNKSQICFVFPGQGSMFPGMGRGFSNNSYFINYFKKADALAEKYHWPSISHYAFAPMRLTLEQQEKVEALALFTFEVAMARSLVEANYRPQVVTAHSFGEYAALVVSGIWDFETGFECVLRREQILPEKNAMGYMIAIAAAKTQIPDLIGNSLYFISNINSPHQTVISASWENISQIETSLSSKGVKFKRLASPQPFHSPLLNEAAKEMSQFAKSLGDLAQSQRTAIFSGVLKRFVSPGNKLKEDLQAIIAKQLLEPVDFEHQIKTIEMQCSHFIEIGPKPLLVDLIKSNFQKKDSQSSAALSLLKTQTKQTTNFTLKRSQVSEPILNRVNAIISKFTGYSIQEIGFEDRFQDDLGIDSIKTMEISIEVINELNLPRELLNSAQQIKTVGELAHKIQTQLSSSPATSQEEAIRTHFSLYRETYRPQPKLDSLFQNSPESEYELISMNATFDLGQIKNRKLKATQLVIDFSKIQDSLELNIYEGKETLSRLLSFFRQFQKLLNSGEMGPQTKIAILTHNENSLASSMALSFFKSLKKEGAIDFVVRIVFDPASISENQKIKLALDELQYGVETDIKYELGKRQILTLEKENVEPTEFPQAGNLIAVGGAKGITRQIAGHIGSTGNWNLFVIGRSHPEDASVVAGLKELKSITDKVFYYQADATCPESMENIFKDIQQNYSSIDVLVQGAGLDLSKKFTEKEDKEIETEFYSKALSSLILSRLCQQFDVKHCILLSSIIARFGNSGQSIYAAANSTAEYFWNTQIKKPKSIVTRWPPWNRMGMTEKPLIYEILASSGVSLLNWEENRNLLERAVGSLGGIIWDAKDFILFQGPLLSTTQLGMNQAKVGPINSALTFQFLLAQSLRESLKDHSLEGRNLIPLALVAYWFMELGKALTSKQVSIQKLVMIRSVDITDLEHEFKIKAKISLEDSQILQLSLFAGKDLIAESEIKENAINYATIQANSQDFKRTLKPPQIYQKQKLFHGSEFQFLKIVTLSSKTSAQSELVFPWIRNDSKIPWWPFLSLMDSGLQLLGIAGLETFQWYGLPIGADKINFWPSIPFVEPLHWNLRNMKLENDILSGDLFLSDTLGKVWGSILNGKFKLVKSL